MKVFVKLITLFVVVFGLILVNTQTKSFDSHSLVSVEAELPSHNDDTNSDADSDDMEIEFHETEYLIQAVTFVFSPKTQALNIIHDSPVYIDSFISSIDIPPSFLNIA